MTDPSITSRWQLPLLAVGQTQKEVTHHEALARVDALLAPAAESSPQNSPPAAPVAGQCWLVGGAPAGSWAGRAQHIACWTSGGWRWIMPRSGMTVRIVDGRMARFDGTGWVLPPVVAAPGGGAVVDSEARTAIVALIASLQTQGWLATPV